MEESSGAEIHELDPENGFEAFISQIHDVVARHGKGGYYLFDSLSDLAADWYSDRMLGNFFMLTCPYLYQMETIAYFRDPAKSAIRFTRYRRSSRRHSFFSTCIIITISSYVHPIKVQGRYSPTLNMLHVRQSDDEFTPVTESITITEILADKPWSRLDSAS